MELNNDIYDLLRIMNRSMSSYEITETYIGKRTPTKFEYVAIEHALNDLQRKNLIEKVGEKYRIARIRSPPMDKKRGRDSDISPTRELLHERSTRRRYASPSTSPRHASPRMSPRTSPRHSEAMDIDMETLTNVMRRVDLDRQSESESDTDTDVIEPGPEEEIYEELATFIIKGRNNKLKELLESGQVSQVNKNIGLLDAAANDNAAAIVYLVRNGANPNYKNGKALITAIEYDSLEALNELIGLGGVVNTRVLNFARNLEEGETKEILRDEFALDV